ncbi:2-hydroxyacyl-CoA dehydratase family protein [Candidatus Bipolaricaulota bacterium]|nr:2-hydroxyacyl-CoA dehydratase family protein [Candidatus Bipolaricaulota bacterium]
MGSKRKIADTDRKLTRYYKSCDKWRALLAALERGPRNPRNELTIGIVSMLLEQDETTIDCALSDKPLLASWYGSAPEIYAAMDLHYVSPLDNVLQSLYDYNLQDLEECDRMGIPEDICSLLRLSTYSVRAGIVPTPTVVIGMMQPCDGMRALSETFKNEKEWGDVPYFALDSTYSYDGSTDEDFAYFAGELRRMIQFLEQHTGRKLDFGRLREVVEESNRQYELWVEYNELRRAIPCPGPAYEGTSVGYILTQFVRSGDPRATDLMKIWLSETEQSVREKRGAVEDERIRILWADIVPAWNGEISNWLAAEWGANIVMDWQSYAPYTAIDTSSEDAMLKGLAKRALTEVMMIRQSGPVQVVLEDVTRVVADYSIDCVIFPGHMGHKDQSGYIGFLRELCRQLRVPFLAFTSSLFDPRYVPLDRLKNTMSEFFSVHGLG